MKFDGIVRRVFFLMVVIILTCELSSDDSETKQVFKSKNLKHYFDNVTLIEYSNLPNKTETKQTQFVVVYPKEFSPKKQTKPTNFGRNSSSIFLSSVKKQYGEDVFNNRKNIQNFLNKINREAVLLIDIVGKNKYHVYLYERSQGNCLLAVEPHYTPRLSVITRVFSKHVSHYLMKIKINHALKFVAFNSSKKYFRYPGNYAKNIIKTKFRISNDNSYYLLKDISKEIKFKYSVARNVHVATYLKTLSQKGTSLEVLSWYKKNEGNQSQELFKRLNFVDNIQIHDVTPFEKIERVDGFSRKANRYKKEFLSRLEGRLKNGILYDCYQFYLMPSEPALRSRFYAIFENKKANMKVHNFRQSAKNNSDKILIEQEKFIFLEDQINFEVSNAKVRRVYFDLNLVFPEAKYTEVELMKLNKLRLNFFKKHLDYFMKSRHGRIEFSDNLKSTLINSRTENFKIMHAYLKKHNFEQKYLLALFRNYFESIYRFKSNPKSGSLKRVELQQNLKHLEPLFEVSDLQLKFDALKYYLRHFRSNTDKDRAHINGIAKRMHTLILKKPELTSDRLVSYLYRIVDPKERNQLGEEIKSLLHSSWKKTNRIQFSSLYHLYRIEKIDWVRTSLYLRDRSGIKVFDWIQTEMMELSKMIVPILIKNPGLNQEVDLSFIHYQISHLSQQQIKKIEVEELCYDCFDDFYLPLILAKFKSKSFLSILNQYLVFQINVNQTEKNKTNLRIVLKYLMDNKFYKDNKFPHVFSQKLNSRIGQAQLSHILKPQLIAMKSRSKDDVELSGISKGQLSPLLHSYKFKDDYAYSLFFNEDRKGNVSLHLCKNSLVTGVSMGITSILNFKNTNGAEANLFSRHFRVHRDEVCLIDDTIYLLKKGRVYYVDFKSKKVGLLAPLNGFYEKKAIKLMKSFQGAIYLFMRNKARYQPDELGVYDPKKKSYEPIILYNKIGFEGSLASNSFEVHAFYPFKGELYISLYSKSPGGKSSYSKLVLLDLKTMKHKIIGRLKNGYHLLHLFNGHAYSFRNEQVFQIKLAENSIQEKFKIEWGKSRFVLPVKGGMLYLEKMRKGNILTFYHTATKKTTRNFNSFFEDSEKLEFIRNKNGLYLLDNSGNILRFPHIK